METGDDGLHGEFEITESDDTTLIFDFFQRLLERGVWRRGVAYL